MSSSKKLVQSPKDVVDLVLFVYVIVRSAQGLYYLAKDLTALIADRFKKSEK